MPTLHGLDPPRCLLVALLPALVVAGHVVNLGDRPDPFVTSELYTHSAPGNPSYHEYTATLATGRVLVLGSVIHQEQQVGGGKALQQAVQERLGLGIDPVQALEH